jgi:hypothetical protein
LSVLNNPLISANVGRSFSTVMVVISFGSGSRHNHRTTMTAAIHAALSFLLNIPHTTLLEWLTGIWCIGSLLHVGSSFTYGGTL